MEGPEDRCRTLIRGTAQVLSEKELLDKLRQKRPLRIKLGVDPTSPDIHLGHTVGLSKLRQFQDMGHHAVLIIGDFTAMIGDPSGRSATRPQLSHDQVMDNAKTYREQAMKILDEEKTQTVFNGEWFEMMHFEQVIHLNSRVTLQQMLQREDFRQRIETGQPIHAHEIQYPIMQGWDSVMIRSDVELGGTDQLFNILVGRDLQKEEGQEQQVAMLLPILEGLDGKQKMSKSLKNYVGVAEAPDTMFGKVMSISDELMCRWYEILLFEELDAKRHPMEAKKDLARRLVERFYDRATGKQAQETFEKRFSQRKIEDSDVPQLAIGQLDQQDVVSVVVQAYTQIFGIKKSRTEARRLVEQGSVRWNGEKVSDPNAQPKWADQGVLKLDKVRAVKLS
ncbi:MAG: tyrosine--tRNA ligase [Verrucomicrobiales bacterium]